MGALLAAGVGVLVTDYGPFGVAETWETNRDTLQAANDAVAAVGGGRVIIPAGGVYEIKGVIQDSHVHIDWSDAKALRSPDGLAPDMIRTRVRTTTGAITTAGTSLSVASADGIERGAIIGIQGAGGMSPVQSSKLSSAITSSDTTDITLDDAAGFPTSGTLVCGAELIAYTSIASGVLGGVTRGALGTTATAHAAAAPIGLAMRLVTSVTAVSGTTITLDPNVPAPLGVTGAAVAIGAIDTGVYGAIDGNRVAGGAPASVNAVRWDLTRFSRAVLDVHDAEAALFLNVSWDNTYDVVAVDCSVPEGSKGADVWLFQQCHRNTGTVRLIGDMWSGLYLDDRTTSATEWDGGCDDNSGVIIIYGEKHTPFITNTALLITGGNRNRYTLQGSGVRTGLVIESGAQSHTHDSSHPTARGNRVDVALSDVYQPWVLLDAGNIVTGYFEAQTNGVNTGGSLIALASPSAGLSPALGSFPDGIQTLPGLAFGNEPRTGFYRITAGQWQWVSNGGLVLRLQAAGVRMDAGKNMYWGTDGSGDLGIPGGRPGRVLAKTAIGLGDAGVLPAAAASNRGEIRFVQGGPGAADRLVICRRDAAGSFAWVDLL